MGLIHCGMGVELCPVKEAVKRFLVLLAHAFPKYPTAFANGFIPFIEVHSEET
jgi:hypothetical protein